MKKNEGIQTLRGIACIMVFLSHYIGSFAGGFWMKNIDLQSSPIRLLWGGHVGVIIFFVLSGFFFFKDIELNVKSYFLLIIRRHLRVYPCFIIAMGGCRHFFGQNQ